MPRRGEEISKNAWVVADYSNPHGSNLAYRSCHEETTYAWFQTRLISRSENDAAAFYHQLRNSGRSITKLTRQIALNERLLHRASQYSCVISRCRLSRRPPRDSPAVSPHQPSYLHHQRRRNP